MAGLNNLISNTGQQTTTLPGWFDTAQQNVVSQAGAANAAAPAPGQTVAQNAVNALSGPSNAFTTAAGTLQNIASGAANPWITDASGQVSPNTATPLGGLFQAQNQQLQQTMPQYTAPVDAAAIGSGNFGSLRGQTAYNKAMADAQANLFAQQNQAALQNQSTGVQAGIGAGTVSQENINNLLQTGQYQQAAPFINASNYGKILGGIQAPTTVNNQTQLSPLNQIAGLVSVLGGPAGTTGLLGQFGVKNGLQGLIDKITGGSSSSGGGTYIPNTNPALDNRDVGNGENTNPGYVAPMIPGETIGGIDQGYNQVDNSGNAIY
jgi:hypothetical protein